MDFLLPYSWLILPAAGLSGCAIGIKLSLIGSALRSLIGERRYFRSLVATSSSRQNESSEYQDEVRPFAFAIGFEYVDGYRSYSLAKRRLRAELWRADDRQTIAVVTSERLRWWTRHHTSFISVLSDGTRITTSDDFDEGDPSGLKGDLVCRGLNFRELYQVHRSRVYRRYSSVDRIGHTNPLSVLEDIERLRVQELAEAGLARYHDEAQISWSYTLAGAYDIYFHARPRQQREYHAFCAAQAESAK